MDHFYCTLSAIPDIYHTEGIIFILHYIFRKKKLWEIKERFLKSEICEKKNTRCCKVLADGYKGPSMMQWPKVRTTLPNMLIKPSIHKEVHTLVFMKSSFMENVSIINFAIQCHNLLTPRYPQN